MNKKIKDDEIMEMLRTRTEFILVGDYIYDYEELVNIMDDEVREYVHGYMTNCTNEQFLTEYNKIHKLRGFGDFLEEIEINNAIYRRTLQAWKDWKEMEG